MEEPNKMETKETLEMELEEMKAELKILEHEAAELRHKVEEQGIIIEQQKQNETVYQETILRLAMKLAGTL